MTTRQPGHSWGPLVRFWSRLATLTVVLTMLCATAGPALAAPDSTVPVDPSAEQQLVDRYSPVVMLRAYDEVCAETGEPYVPMAVDALLDNPEVALRQVGNDDAVIQWAPTAENLAGLGSATYLDFPGESLNPGCTYAEYQSTYASLAEAAVYAHVAEEEDRPGYVAVQYWFYWYYNDWNDRHESDWEFIQVLFEADDVEEALTVDPVGVGFAQHEGGEIHGWGSDELEREDSHLLVYPSQGSHASYFAPALYLGRGASEGFGCDNTEDASTRVKPRIVLLPDAPTQKSDPAAWLGFEGRWGERQSGPNNGPQGPVTKPQWDRPVSWQEGLRPSSFEIPGGSQTPSVVIGAFCSVVGQGSAIYLGFSANPALTLFVLGLLALGAALVLRRTSWRRVAPLPVARQRAAGEIVRAAASLYRRRWPAMMTIGLLAVPVGVIGTLASAGLTRLPYLGDAVSVATDRGDPVSRAIIAVGAGVGLWPVTVVLMSGAVAHLLEQEETDRAPAGIADALAALRAVKDRLSDLASAFVPVAIAIAILQLSFLGAPIAAWLSVRYQYVGQVVMLEQRRGWTALTRTSGLVKGRWWYTAAFSFLTWAGVHLLGVLLGLAVLVLVPALPLWGITLIVVATEIGLTPLGALALTLVYGDAVAERAVDSAPDPALAPDPTGAG